MSGWNFADVWEHIATLVPDAPALVHGSTRRTWGELDARADGVARALVDVGLRPGERVAQYLYNANEYLESFFACAKAGLVPVNTNHRYVEAELAHLWTDAGVAAVVFHAAFAARIEQVRPAVPGVRAWLWVDDGTGECPPWAIPYEAAAGERGDRVTGPRSGDDVVLVYTGGTTGRPKGVLWRQDDLYNNCSQSIWHDPVTPDLGAVTARVQRRLGPVALPACPLMHGTGLFVALQQLSQAGTVVTLTSRRLDVAELLDVAAAEGVNVAAIVGDVFSRPILDALDAEPGRWDLGRLKVLVSSGAMWSAESKDRLLAHLPRVTLIDMFASSEAAGMGQSVVRAGGSARTASFQAGPSTRVVTADGRDVEPGSGEVGLVAVGGFQPFGYHNDPEATAATFRLLDGRTYAIPGDHATVEADGTLTLLGRGSTCINTGGEKVYPEEVEEALKQHPAVRDAAVVGVAHDRFGQEVVAIVEGEIDADDLIAHVKGLLASYKAPRRVLAVDTLGRAANGKLDRRRLQALATR